MEWTDKEYAKIQEIRRREHEYTDWAERMHHENYEPILPYLAGVLDIKEWKLKLYLKDRWEL